MNTVRGGALVALALAVLNLALTFQNVWPTLAISLDTALSLELAVGLVALTLGYRRFGVPGRATRTWLAALWVLLIVWRYSDVTTQSLYGREIHLYWDLRLVPEVGSMFAYVADPWLAAAVVAGLLLLPVVVYVPVRWAVGRVSEAMREAPLRRALGLMAAGVLLAAAGQALGAPIRVPEPVRFATPVVPSLARAVGALAAEATGAGLAALPPPPPMHSDLAHLGGADVLLVFLESYGVVSWDRPALANALSDSRAAFDADIRDTGRSVVSARVESTTFGGESWLAHISLLSGTEVRDQRTNVRLMAQERDTMVKAFGRRGYRTVAVMPGVLRGWPQGAFYGFDEIYDLSRLDYRGPPFGWWSITDQFALARVDALELAMQPRGPAFVFFPTITTHAPFTPVPPYQPDWTRILTPVPYDADELDRAWADQPDWLDLGPGYVQSLQYAYATLGGYLRLRADRDLVVILVGDHQPPALLTGEGASWDVPAHIIASRPALIDRLRQRGFVDGLATPQPAIAQMHTLLPLLLEAFGGDEP
jgi:hypothetical protein